LRGVRGVRHPGGLRGRPGAPGPLGPRGRRALHAGLPGPVRGGDRGRARALRRAERVRLLLRDRVPRDHLHPDHAARPLVARAHPGGPGRPAPVRRVVSAVSVPCLGKINLFLRVLAREADGFHGLETVFCLVSLADRLTAERREAGGIELEVTGAKLGPPEENLAVKAARMVLDATGHRFGVRLRLEKRIPVGAGLGGGSSDAAGALLLVNRLAGNAVPRHELLQFAARLGSDVPFFLSGGPLALAWGHGERLFRLPPLPAAPALLVTPPTQIATREAYGWVDAARQDAGRRGAVALDLDALSTWGDIGRMAGNDFESPVF